MDPGPLWCLPAGLIQSLTVLLMTLAIMVMMACRSIISQTSMLTAFLMRHKDQIIYDKYIYGPDVIFYGPQEINYYLTNIYIYMVLMTFLMAGQLCAGLHRHLLTALSPHLLILVLAIIVIAIIIVTIIIAIIIIAIIIITRPKPAYGRQGLDWIVGPGYSFVVFSTNKTMETNQKP